MENSLRPPVVRYIVSHNLTASGAAMKTVTSTVTIIPLNGVPPGHYYIDVAAENIVGIGESARESFTGIELCNIFKKLLIFLKW